MNADDQDCREKATRIAELLSRTDEITRVIFIAGLRARADGRLTFEQMQERVGDLVRRHRAGEDIQVSELEFERVERLGK